MRATNCILVLALCFAACVEVADARRGGRSGSGTSSRRTSSRTSSRTGASNSRTTTKSKTSSRSKRIKGFVSKSGKTIKRLSVARKVSAALALASTKRKLKSRRRGGRWKGRKTDDSDSESDDDYAEFEVEYESNDSATVYTIDVDNDHAPTMCLYHYEDDDDIDEDGSNAQFSYCVVPWSLGDTEFQNLRWSNLQVDRRQKDGVSYDFASATATGAFTVTLEYYVPSANVDSPFGGDGDDNQLLANAAKYRLLIPGVQDGEQLTQIVYSSSASDFKGDLSTLAVGDQSAAFVWPEVQGSSGEVKIGTTSTTTEPAGASYGVAPGYQLGDATVLVHTFTGVASETVDFSPDMQVELQALGLEDPRPTSMEEAGVAGLFQSVVGVLASVVGSMVLLV